MSSETVEDQESETCRTLVRVVSRNKRSLKVIVPSWDLHRAVTLRLFSDSPAVLLEAQAGTRLFARVNTGAEEGELLVFSCFEAAPEPLTEEEVSALAET